MPELDLHALPPELQAALEQAWPGCPEAQRRAVLAPHRLGGTSIWPDNLWPWQSSRHWWRPGRARECRKSDGLFFAARVSDVLGATREARLFDPEQPFFETPWTHAQVLLRSPAPDAFSDADFWAITQLLFGGDVYWATRTTQDWAASMRANAALQGARRSQWLTDALWRLEASAKGDFL
jgi:hypothetical protein